LAVDGARARHTGTHIGTNEVARGPWQRAVACVRTIDEPSGRPVRTTRRSVARGNYSTRDSTKIAPTIREAWPEVKDGPAHCCRSIGMPLAVGGRMQAAAASMTQRIASHCVPPQAAALRGEDAATGPTESRHGAFHAAHSALAFWSWSGALTAPTSTNNGNYRVV